MPLVTPLPTPPSSSDTANFNTRADAFLGALPTLATEVNAVGTNMETQYNYVVANVSTTATSASQATTAANSAVSAKNSIEVLFLGSKTSNPTTNNSGGALVVGCKYFNTTVGEDRVWTGTTWVSSTALGGTVASLSVDGELKLKVNTWHKDSENLNRLYLESGGSGATILKGNQLVYWDNIDTELFKVINNGNLHTFGKASLNAGSSFLTNHSVTVGNQNGGGSSVGMGMTVGGQGAYGTVFADSTHFVAAANTYYNGADRFSANGYAPKIRLYTSDNVILFQQTDNGAAGNAQAIQNIAKFDSQGVFSVNSRNGYGYVGITGNSSASGLITFHQSNGTRSGYIGNSADTAGDHLRIVSENSRPWQFEGMAPRSSVDATSGNDLPRLSQFASTQAANGYTKLPNGLIVQWGTINVPTNSTNTYSLTINFPNNAFAGFSTATGSQWGNSDSSNINVSGLSTSQITLTNFSPNTQNCYWMAIGN